VNKETYIDNLRRPRPWLHWSQNRHNTTVWTDSRQASRNQPLFMSAATLKPILLECCLPTTADCLAQ